MLHKGLGCTVLLCSIFVVVLTMPSVCLLYMQEWDSMLSLHCIAIQSMSQSQCVHNALQQLNATLCKPLASNGLLLNLFFVKLCSINEATTN